MTLCITLRLADQSVLSISDSQLTLEADGTRWTNDHAVKIHYATQDFTIYAGPRFDVTFAVSGNLSLGLQSILYVDACLKSESGTWADAIVNIVKDKLWEFWAPAINRGITYSIALHNHKGRARIFEWECEGNHVGASFSEVAEDQGLLFSVHGDRAPAIRQRILSEVSACGYCEVDPQLALAFASLRALQAAIDDETSLYVGGQIQACLLKDYEAHVLVCEGLNRHLRSAFIESDEARSYGTLDLRHPWLDQSKSLAQLIEAYPTDRQLVRDPARPRLN